MKTILKIEEAALFIASLVAFPYLDLSWWWFVGCILVPDVSMLGYLAGPKAGALSYNLFHHKGVAVLIGVGGILIASSTLEFIGLILFAHASMDRMLGYGLKYEEGFRFTHLGLIGKDAVPTSRP
jgi:hypothetical protein